MASVFLTGGTGFVGGAAAFNLLRDPRVERLAMLVRGDSPVHAEQRLRRSLIRFGKVDSQWQKVEVLVGDTATATIPPGVVDATTHVVHLAACTSFRAVREARRTNVDGTLAIANQLRGGRRLARFLHVGTAFQCGVVNERVIKEETPSADSHLNEYTKTKAAAASSLRSMSDLPLLLALPSIVVGHTALGVAPSTSLFWYYRALALAGIAPFAESRRRDIVAVDYVADALLHLLFLHDPKHQRYHVSAGEGSANTWQQIRSALGQAQTTTIVNAEALAAHHAWTPLVADDQRFRRGLDLCARFSTVPVEWFANERLLQSGMPPPPRFTDYAARCLSTAGPTLLGLLSDDD